MKKSTIIITIITIIISQISLFIIRGDLTWYDSLILPETIPTGAIYGLFWGIIYILTAAGAIIVWNKAKDSNQKTFLTMFYSVNIFLFITWLVGFFRFHMIQVALLHLLLLIVSIMAIIVYNYSISKLSAALTVPYLFFLLFLQYNMYMLYALNQ